MTSPGLHKENDANKREQTLHLVFLKGYNNGLLIVFYRFSIIKMEL